MTTRKQYLDKKHVKGFLKWAKPFVTGKCELKQSWPIGNTKEQVCQESTTLFEAYQLYRWPFTIHLPGTAADSTKGTVDIQADRRSPHHALEGTQ